MSKVSELSQVLEEMVACGEGLIRTANILREMFTTADRKPAEPETAERPEEESAAKEASAEAPERKTYSYVEVRKVCSAKSNAGFTDRVKTLIERYGNGRLSGVKEEDYAALMAELEEIQ